MDARLTGSDLVRFFRSVGTVGAGRSGMSSSVSS